MSFPPELDSTQTELPRLRIHHFMLWTLAVALVLTIYKGFSISPQNVSTLGAVQVITQGIPQAIGVATLGLGFYWRFKGASFFNEVGHCLLLLASANLIGALLVNSLHFFFREVLNDSSSMFLYIMIVSAVWPFVLGILLLLIGKKAADTASWNRFCKIVGMMYLATPLFYLFFYLPSFRRFVISDPSNVIAVMALSQGISILWCLLCALAIREDISFGWHRHWSHWCGVVIWFFGTASGIVFSVYGYFTHA